MPFGQGTVAGVMSIVLASILWGTTGTAASLAPQISALAIGAFAMGGGGILLVVHARKYLVKHAAQFRDNLQLTLLGGLAVAVYPLAFYTSMRWSGVAIGTMVSIASAPFFTVLMERFIGNRKVALQWVFSFSFGVVGVVLMMLGKTSLDISTEQSSLAGWGVVVGLLAGFTYAAYSWVARQMIELHIHSKAAMASQFGIAAVILLPSLFLTGDNLFANSINTSVALYMAIVPMFIGYLLFGYGLNHVTASSATLITLLEPAVATLFAIVIVGERFMLIGWLGMLFIGLCLLLQVVKVPALQRLA